MIPLIWIGAALFAGAVVVGVFWNEIKDFVNKSIRRFGKLSSHPHRRFQNLPTNRQPLPVLCMLQKCCHTEILFAQGNRAMAGNRYYP